MSQMQVVYRACNAAGCIAFRVSTVISRIGGTRCVRGEGFSCVCLRQHGTRARSSSATVASGTSHGTSFWEKRQRVSILFATAKIFCTYPKSFVPENTGAV